MLRKLLILFLYPLKGLFHLYLKTLHIEIEGKKEFEKLLNSNQSIIVALWHNKLFMVPLFSHLTTERHFQIAISQSRDGEVPSRLVNTYKRFSTIRVRHNGRHEALHQMVQAIKRGNVVIITPDGPRGPLHVIKPGLHFLQQQTAALIVPFTWHAETCWKLKSWDRFEIPKPFSRVSVRFEAASTTFE